CQPAAPTPHGCSAADHATSPRAIDDPGLDSTMRHGASSTRLASNAVRSGARRRRTFVRSAVTPAGGVRRSGDALDRRTSVVAQREMPVLLFDFVKVAQ